MCDSDGNKLSGNDGNGAEATSQEVRRSRLRSEILLNQHGEAYVNPDWILLDSESSEHLFCNEKLVSNVRQTTDGEMLRMHSNGGSLDTSTKANFGSIEVWFCKTSLANILSLALITNDFRVTMDSWVENALIVHISEGHVLKFNRVSERLYALDASNISVSRLNNAFSFLSTVDSNKGMFKARDVRKADESMVLHRRTNHMAKDKFLRVVKNDLIRNCPVTLGDVKRSHVIYGPSIPALKGRTRYEETPRVREREIMQLPVELYEDLKNVTLCVDFFYVNGLTVFHTISRRVGYRTVSFPTSRSRISIGRELKTVKQMYHARGFRITDMHADSEFKKVETDVLPIRLECCGTDDHVPEVERSIQTLKNEARTVCHAMPYKCFPRLMVREIILQGNTFLNAFGNGNMVASGLTPRNIIDNLPHVDYNDLKHEFGEYVQLHVTERNQRTNTMRTRTVGAIVLGPRKITGKYNYMSLESGSQIDGRVTPGQLPITNDVIERVETFGRQQRQPFRMSRTLIFEWRPGNPIGDEDAFVIQNEPQAQQVVIPGPIDITDPGPNPFAVRDDQMAVGAEENVLPFGDQQRRQGGQQTGNQHRTIIIAPNVENRGAIATNVENRGANDEMVMGNQDGNVDMDNGEELGANENGGKDEDVDAPEVVDGEGAPRVETVVDIEQEGLFEEAIDADTVVSGSDSDDEGQSDEDSVERRRNEERQRRSNHWAVDTSDESGVGKRRKFRNRRYGFLQKRKGFRRNKRNGRIKHAASFLQKEFKDLEKDEKRKYFKHAYKEMEETGNSNTMERFVTGVLFASMSAKKGIDKYGKEAEQKLIAEFAQLLEYSVFHGRVASELTAEERKGAANMINLVEEKLNRGHTKENPVLRARSVFNGRVQRGLYTKEQTASPTVSQDAFTMTCIIDAIEERDVAVTDIKGAYLNAKMKDMVIMKIKGPEVGLFCDLDESLKKFVTKENGKDTLYVQLDKALYGCVQSALLWYELYLTTLKSFGFVLNPYDSCVANADIDGSQCTICWYVDDNKISHKKSEVVDKVIGWIEGKFGEMSTTRGDIHDFLGMNVNFKKGKVTIGMKKHILRAIDTFLDEIVRSAATPARGYLFEVRDGATKLDETRADNFHSVVAALLFISRRCRLDIQVAVGFLTTRVSEPDEDDWAKLKRVLQYLRGTMDLTLTIGGTSIQHMHSWVDVSYGVHTDGKSHTGGCISFGIGAVGTKCQKQKLNVKSSTEGEIVGVSDYLPSMIWSRMFLEAQGYPVVDNVLYQDNQSAIKIIKNGRRSSGQKTRHMNIRYLWFKDRLASEKIRVVYCPTGNMLADFFTKPLQGSLFRKFRDVVMGYTTIDSIAHKPEKSSQQERVGKDDIQRDLCSSGSHTSGMSEEGPSASVESKVLSYLDVAKKGLV